MSCRSFVWAGALKDAEKADTKSVADLSRFVDEQGTLRWKASAGKRTILYLAERVMYEGTHASANVCEFKHYVNLLDPRATAEFIRVTHERYYRETPPEIWRRIRAVFTDEPSFMTGYVHPIGDWYKGDAIPIVDKPIFSDRPPAVPWADGLLTMFRRIKRYDLRPRLFELFVSDSDEARYTRQDYYQVITDLYARAFYEQVLRWCQAHGIAWSGHVLAKENIVAHTIHHGSLFAVIRKMDLPGIDMLDSDPRSILGGEGFMTVKQVSSVAHLTGAKMVHSESSDWSRGTTGGSQRSWKESGRAICNTFWASDQITAYWGWKEIGEEAYRAYNDYMGRLALFLRGGSHVCDVAVLYPIRSAWLNYTPTSWRKEDEVATGRSQEHLYGISRGYTDLVRHLLRNQIDLDILDEQALVEGRRHRGALRIADEAYGIVILPGIDAIGLQAARALAAFARAGGIVISAGPLPRWAESPANTTALRREWSALFGRNGAGQIVSMAELPAYLRTHGAADIVVLDEPNPDILCTHRRLDGRDVYFMINNGPEQTTIRPGLRAPGPFTLYRPLTGDVVETADKPVLDLKEYEGVFLVGVQVSTTCRRTG